MPPTEPASTSAVLLLVVAITDFVLLAGLIYFLLRNRRLSSHRDNLLRERDVIYDFLRGVGDLVSELESVDLDLVAQRILVHALQAARAEAGAVYLVDEPGSPVLRAGAVAGLFPPLVGDSDPRLDVEVWKSSQVQELVRQCPGRIGEGLVGTVAQTGAGLLIPDATKDSRVPDYSNALLKPRSLVFAPMRFRGEVLGVLATALPAGRDAFNANDLDLLESLADQASVSLHFARLKDALAEKKLLDNDLTVARQIQRSLLPETLPSLPGIELGAFNFPAREIGGDYYDFIPLEDNRLGIVIADVSGKGISGAMMMAICRSVLRAQAAGVASPAAVLQSLNRVLSTDMAEDMFVTILYMVLDLTTSELLVARGGHLQPVVLHADGSLEEIDSGGMAVGLADPDLFNRQIEEKRIQLRPGDLVAAFTDGLTETQNAAGNEWGTEGLFEAIQSGCGDAPSQLLHKVRRQLERFAGQVPEHDDMTMVALRVT